MKKCKYVSRTIYKNDTKGKCARGIPLEVWKNKHPEIDNTIENSVSKCCVLLAIRVSVQKKNSTR